MGIPVLDAGALDALAAVDALERALLDGLDPDADPPRIVLDAGDGRDLLVMPSAAAGPPVVKLVSVGGEPRVQGLCVVFDPGTLAPAALIDGIALTNLRTSAVSALAVRHLLPAGARPRRLLVLGRGPQAHAHAAAVQAVAPSIDDVRLAGRGEPFDPGDADVICCCTTARAPLFDGGRVGDGAVVVAIGSHEPGARETDDALARRAAPVVVESTASALREAGDVVQAIESGALRVEELVTLADVVRGRAPRRGAGPRLFKSTGMAWEDAVVAAAVLQRSGPPPEHSGQGSGRG